MTRAPNSSRPFAPVFDTSTAGTQDELDEALKTIRTLQRQIDKEQARYEEIARAYNLTVANLVSITHENQSLERERDMWRARAQGTAVPFTFGNSTISLSPDEIGAIRKAMARLHHPDTGGDSERLKMWNATLDALER